MQSITNNPNDVKITAEQVETDCPAELTQLGDLIAHCFHEAAECEARAEEYRLEAGSLIVEAKELCDAGGFAAFRKKYFPTVSQSRAYELMAIATGKRTISQVREQTRQRVASTRARQKAKKHSATVAESNTGEVKPPDNVVQLVGVRAAREAAAPALQPTEALIEHFTRSSGGEQKALIDHVKGLSAAIDPFRQMIPMDPDTIAARTEETVGVYKAKLIRDALQMRLEPRAKKKIARLQFKSVETTDPETGNRVYARSRRGNASWH
ncbi:hypothetical protein XH99_01015 [Bradyrhizobium nanningense]|uniref:Uncharacterized protein n=1 Tax=Bradyrhizobium nanningense TaxID=1325118 RepID=A0A4Q0SFV9_9BRAD|nr:hypothetical protein [Bradyrhizobium nanningense]RXH34359.1 hypothetical protein XH84_06975 [Bradyrhizobium nanningense]RXH38373.1 hypothetical protein XH99_01015 [Bradyrhizobium nanningense]